MRTVPTRLAARVVARCVGLGERLGAGDRVVAGTAVQEVVAEAAEDDVVGVQRVEQHVVGCRLGRVRVKVERRQVGGLLQGAADVDDRDLRAELGRDLGVEVGTGDRRDAVQRLAVDVVVAARLDPAVVAEDAVAGRCRRRSSRCPSRR